MTDVKVYQRMAALIAARRNCIAAQNTEWFDKHTERLHEIEKEYLPHGGGFDSGTKIDLDRSRANKIVLHTSYHHMNDVGMYDGWTEHDVILTPDFIAGFDMRITGKDRNDIKEFIAQSFECILSMEIEQ